MKRRKSKTLTMKFIENPTRANAIKAFCFECMGYPELGVVPLIRDCTVKNCIHYTFRPYKREDEDYSSKEKIIAHYDVYPPHSINTPLSEQEPR